MDQVKVSALKDFVDASGNEFKSGEEYVVDSDTAKAWAEKELCEIKEDDPIGKAVAEIETQVAEKIRSKFSKALEVPAVITTNKEKDWSIGDLAARLMHKDYSGIRNKYGEKIISIGSDTAILPTPMVEEVLYSKGTPNEVFNRVRKVPMTSDTLKVPVLDQAGVSPSGGSVCYFGGIVGAYDSEDDDANATEPSWTSVTLNANKYTMYTYATLEAQQDLVANLNQELPALFTKAYQDHMSYFILQGPGTTAPTGIINNAGTVSVARGTAANIAYSDVVNMVTRMASEGDGWCWLVSRTALAELLTMEDTEGNLVYQPNARDAIGRTLLGYPVVVCSHASPLGTAGDLLLVNLAEGYLFGDRMEATLSFSDHVSFLKGRRCWKLEARNDGKPVHASTLVDADGTTEIGELIQLGSAGS